MRAWSVFLFLTTGATLMLGQSATPPWRFEPIQPDLFATGTTFVNAWADYDGDGDLDLFVGFNGTPNRLYRNDRGVFVDVAAAAGVADARADARRGMGRLRRRRRSGPAGRLRRRAALGPAVRAAALSQRRRPLHRRDERGWTRGGRRRRAAAGLDRFRWRRRSRSLRRRSAIGRHAVPQRRRTLHGRRGRVGLADARKTVGAVWFDYDEDGDLDLYAAHMDGDANGLYRNDKGRFTDVAEAAGLAWGGRAPSDATNGTVRPCAADVNGDGRLDLFTANYGTNGLFLNRGGGKFEDVSAAWGIAIDAPLRHLRLRRLRQRRPPRPLRQRHGHRRQSYRDYLFRNTGTRFEDVTPDNIRALEADHGAQWADFDGDGDEDLALTGAQPAGMHLLLRNLLPAPARRARFRFGSSTAAAARRGPAPRCASTRPGRGAFSPPVWSIPAPATTRKTTCPCTRVLARRGGWTSKSPIPPPAGAR